MKGLFENRSMLFQIGLLIYLLIAGSLLSFGILALLGESEADNFYHIQTSQFISDILSYLMPALGVAFMCSREPKKYLSVGKIDNFKNVAIAVLIMIAVTPTIEFATFLNSEMTLPHFMAPIENWMREMEDRLTEIVESLLTRDDAISLIINIIVIGVMAGITEEFLFRGALLSIIRKKIKNPHVAIWIVAIIFSAVHLQFFGFIPRMLLGALLGYLLYWTGNIWVPVIAHAFNNTLLILCVYFGVFGGEESFITEETNANDMIIIGLLAVVGLIIFVFCVKGMRKSQVPD
ncbi:MAG: CPBP family intramembrane metalloprotease [Tannerella sp.]|jgi:membrane protease YdiL (CAAX protease family)|nr:CPBP family intramembrane metalloprotease [Tannerella sp.]